jgi:hypothetical protein
MKRAFLFGLSWFFITGVIAALAGLAGGKSTLGSIIMALICAPLSIWIMRTAKQAPPHFSRLHAVIGWLCGFFVVDAAAAVVVGAVLLTR